MWLTQPATAVNDGKEFQIVKIFYPPDGLQQQLTAVGIDAEVHLTDHYFIYASGTKR
jgi:hypothetical protein